MDDRDRDCQLELRDSVIVVTGPSDSATVVGCVGQRFADTHHWVCALRTAAIAAEKRPRDPEGRSTVRGSPKKPNRHLKSVLPNTLPPPTINGSFVGAYGGTPSGREDVTISEQRAQSVAPLRN